MKIILGAIIRISIICLLPFDTHMALYHIVKQARRVEQGTRMASHDGA